MSTRPKHWLRGGWPDLWVDWCWLHLHETIHRDPNIPIFPDQGAGGRNLDASRTSRPHLAARQGWHRLLPGHGPMGWSLEPWLGSMYWFKGTITRKPHIQWENLWFPVGFPWVSLQPLLWGLGDYEKGHVELWNQRFWHVLTEDSTNLGGSFVGLASNWRPKLWNVYTRNYERDNHVKDWVFKVWSFHSSCLFLWGMSGCRKRTNVANAAAISSLHIGNKGIEMPYVVDACRCLMSWWNYLKLLPTGKHLQQLQVERYTNPIGTLSTQPFLKWRLQSINSITYNTIIVYVKYQ